MNIQTIKISPEERSLFKHSTKGRVRFAEVDAFKIVHNVQYFFWLEWARIMYMENAGVEASLKNLIKELPLVAVHAEIDYISPAFFGMEYEVLTRISYIKDSSLEFNNIILAPDDRLMVRAKAVIANVDQATNSSTRIPDHVRELIKSFEGDSVTIC